MPACQDDELTLFAARSGKAAACYLLDQIAEVSGGIDHDSSLNRPGGAFQQPAVRDPLSAGHLRGTQYHRTMGDRLASIGQRRRPWIDDVVAGNQHGTLSSSDQPATRGRILQNRKVKLLVDVEILSIACLDACKLETCRRRVKGHSRR